MAGISPPEAREQRIGGRADEGQIRKHDMEEDGDKREQRVNVGV